MRNYLNRLFKNLFIIMILTFVSTGFISAGPVVTLNFFNNATVNDTAIYLHDIAEISTDSLDLKQRLSAMIAGEIAPPGYSRFINTADLLLYRLQPANKNVTFKVAQNKRISVKTVGVPRRIGDYLTLVEDYLRLHTGWKKGEWSFNIENSEDTWESLDLPVEVSVEQPVTVKTITPFPRGHIKLQLVVKQKERVICIPISCFLKICAPVVISKHALNRNKVIDSNDIELRKVDLSGFGPEPYFKMEDLVGKKTIGDICQGSIFYNKLVMPIPAVSKGDQLTIKVTQGNVRISVAAIARENGNLGQKIWVENTMTHKLIRVVLKDKNSAVIL